MAALLTATLTDLEPGDRFEVRVRGAGGELALPAALRDAMAWSVETEAGEPVESGRRDDGVLRVAELPKLLAERWNAVWLEYLGPGRLRLSVERGLPAPPSEITTGQGVAIALDARDLTRFQEVACSATAAEFALALRAARLGTRAGFDQLMCLPLVRDMELLEHQIRTAKTVLRRLRGRALLCDEVGLGKTIEAGLVLSELHLRGLARAVLILVPPSLIEQWQGEMRRKFGLDFISHDDPAFRHKGAAAWQECNHIIASIHTAKREPHRAAILQRKWDLVIVDEAHHLRNRTTQLWRLGSEIQKQFILLLTATPVQNNLDELFNLVTLLEPGLLSTAKQFQKQFVDRKDKVTPRNVEELHRLLAEVMVRNRRSTVGLQFTRRWARTDRVVMAAAEQALYAAATEFVRQHLRAAGAEAPPADTQPAEGQPADTPAKTRTAKKRVLSRMALLSLQMALGSSSRAAAGTLARLAEHEELSQAERTRLAELSHQADCQADNAKVDRLLQLLAEFADKMVVFTQFRATQELLAERLPRAGHELAVFHGGLSRLEKEAAIARFRGDARILLCTESGSEGRNLQFAHAVCNFDLPWNPMKIEQRIGRLSRIGQTHDVYVFNLVAAGTVEAAVLHLLEAKLNMFELVIGEIDMILGNLDEEREFQDVVADLWAEAGGPDDFHKRMEDLGNRLLAARDAYLVQKGIDERLFADQFAPDR